MTDPTVISYGELGIDNIIQVPQLPSAEQAAFPTGDSYHIGGAAANAAVWLASWGVPVALIGNAIGDDDLGRDLQSRLAAFPQLDRRWLWVVSGGSTPFCRILVTPDGERSILVFRYPQSPKTDLTEEMLSGVRFLSLDLYGGQERVRAARLAQAANVTTVVNDAIEPEHPVLAHTDILVNSAAYLRAAAPSAEPAERSHELQAACAGTIVTTDGPRPIHVLTGEGDRFSVEPPSAEAVDATGAGDAFRAGLIYGLLAGWDLAAAIQFGAAAGSLKVSLLGGASSVPTIERVTEWAERARVIDGA